MVICVDCLNTFSLFQPRLFYSSVLHYYCDDDGDDHLLNYSFIYSLVSYFYFPGGYLFLSYVSISVGSLANKRTRAIISDLNLT